MTFACKASALTTGSLTFSNALIITPHLRLEARRSSANCSWGPLVLGVGCGMR